MPFVELFLMHVRVHNYRVIYAIFYCLSFIFIFVHLNFNVKTFQLSHDVQRITLGIQSLQHDVNALDLEYISKTQLEIIEKKAVETLGMVRQQQPLVFSNQRVGIR